jgi:hypothetical protein
MVNFKNALLALALAGAATAHVSGISVPSSFTVTSDSQLPIAFSVQDGPIT